MNLESFGRLGRFHPRGNVTPITFVKTKIFNLNELFRLVGASEKRTGTLQIARH